MSARGAAGLTLLLLQPHALWAAAPVAAPAPAPTTLPAAAASAVLIEAPVAMVDRTVITLGEVEAEARIVLVRRGGLAGAHREVDDGLRAAVLQYLINQVVILAEARRLQLFQVTDQEIATELLQIESAFRDRDAYLSFLDANGLTEEDVREIVHRDVRVAKFLNSRVQMVARLDVADLRSYFAAHQEDFEGRSFEEVRGEIEGRLGRERHADAVREWLGDLKARAEIRVLRPFEDLPEAP